jgi:tRNA pseudouridine55 synthase
LVGKATTHAPKLSKLDKTYEVTMRLGQTSTTGDEEGEKTPVSDTIPSEKAVLEGLASFQGHIMQTPPAYSAIKVNGQRAYKLARAGKVVELKARPATVYKIKMTSYTYPEVKFTAHVSSGTYIRTLVEDAGVKLGTGAYMSDLRRTRVGRFNIAHAILVSKETDIATIAAKVKEIPIQ